MPRSPVSSTLLSLEVDPVAAAAGCGCPRSEAACWRGRAGVPGASTLSPACGRRQCDDDLEGSCSKVGLPPRRPRRDAPRIRALGTSRSRAAPDLASAHPHRAGPASCSPIRAASGRARDAGSTAASRWSLSPPGPPGAGPRAVQGHLLALVAAAIRQRRETIPRSRPAGRCLALGGRSGTAHGRRGALHGSKACSGCGALGGASPNAGAASEARLGHGGRPGVHGAREGGTITAALARARSLGSRGRCPRPLNPQNRPARAADNPDSTRIPRAAADIRSGPRGLGQGHCHS